MTDKLDLAKVRRFQSIESADVELGDLTVIVGPSNSGKSAFGRALRALARNTTGSGHVTHGSKTAIVAAHTTSGHTVLLERGAGTSTYKTVSPTGAEENYTKAGTQVPEDVAKLLAVPPGSPDAHFTTQFDGPFLLDQNGTTVSKVLGELTNATVLAEAAREANRRRTEATREANIRRQDANRAAQDVRERYGSLPVRKAAVGAARALLDEVSDAASLAARLRHLAETTLTARKAATAQRARSDLLTAALSGAEEQLKSLESALAVPTELSTLAERTGKARRVAAAQRASAEAEGERADACETELAEALEAMGLCPLCGSSTKTS